MNVNSQDKRILIVPCIAQIAYDERRISMNYVHRKMDYRAFASKLSETWDLDKDFVYSSAGKFVTSDKKTMFLHDFNNPQGGNITRKKGMSNGKRLSNIFLSISAKAVSIFFIDAFRWLGSPIQSCFMISENGNSLLIAS